MFFDVGRSNVVAINYQEDISIRYEKKKCHNYTYPATLRFLFNDFDVVVGFDAVDDVDGIVYDGIIEGIADDGKVEGIVDGIVDGIVESINLL